MKKPINIGSVLVMNVDLYNLCRDYCNCFDAVNLLNEVNGVKDNQRLKLYRLLLHKMSALEKEMVNTIVENELE